MDIEKIPILDVRKYPKHGDFFRNFSDIRSEIPVFKIGYSNIRIRSETYFMNLSFEKYNFLVFGYPIRNLEYHNIWYSIFSDGIRVAFFRSEILNCIESNIKMNTPSLLAKYLTLFCFSYPHVMWFSSPTNSFLFQARTICFILILTLYKYIIKRIHNYPILLIAYM